MNEVNETVNNEVEVSEVEELKKAFEGLDRNQLRDELEKMPVEKIYKLSKILFDSFKCESTKYLEKGRENAALNSRKLTGKLETVFMVWRKKTIEAAKNKAVE